MHSSAKQAPIPSSHFDARTPHPSCRVYGVPIQPGAKISPAQSRHRRITGEQPFGLQDHVIKLRQRASNNYTGGKAGDLNVRTCCKRRKMSTMAGANRGKPGMTLSKRATFKTIADNNARTLKRREVMQAVDYMTGQLPALTLTALDSVITWAKVNGQPGLQRAANNYRGAILAR